MKGHDDMAFVLVALTFLLTTTTAYATQQRRRNDQSKPPNIVLLFADNLGYNDIGTFGSPTAQTPNIDRLAYEGMKFHHWNSAAHLCSASRAALLTGLYPVRTGVYPSVFEPTSTHGLSPTIPTIASHLTSHNYSTAIIGKWHLGHRPPYLPTNHGFDSWLGIPYHMSGGSTDSHHCGMDTNDTMWLPLYDNVQITEQPVVLENLAERYANAARTFIEQSVRKSQNFFLYVPFSHVHQLCAPQDDFCQYASSKFSKTSPKAKFVDAVQEMDWIAGEVLDALDVNGVSDETVVIFTSDNGPWVAEQECSGSKGPFEGRWLQDNVDQTCTACPHSYKPSPVPSNPRRCTYQPTLTSQTYSITGVHCGHDTGLGSTWEANLRMPALIRYPGQVTARSESSALLSTLDILPTVLNLVGMDVPEGLDGIDITRVLLGRRKTTTANDEVGSGDDEEEEKERVLFFWRDGFSSGPLPSPHGRFDISAAKYKHIKAWFYTKSGHYNDDEEVFHDPPLLFDVWDDPAEAYPLDPANYVNVIDEIQKAMKEHRDGVNWTEPLTLGQDERVIPCVDRTTGCRTTATVASAHHVESASMQKR